MENNTNGTEHFLSQNLILSFSCTYPLNNKRVAPNYISEGEEDNLIVLKETKKENVKATIRKWHGASYTALTDHVKETRDCIRKVAIDLPFSNGGQYLVPLAKFSRLMSTLDLKKEGWLRLIQLFKEEYPILKENGIRESGGILSGKDYPLLRNWETYFSWSVGVRNVESSFSAPTNLKEFNEDLYNKIVGEEGEKLKVRLEETVNSIEGTLFTQMEEVVEELTEKITKHTPGQGTAFRVNSLSKFKELFSYLSTGGNLSGNKNIEELCTKALGILGEKPLTTIAREMRSGEEFRESMGEKFKELKEHITTVLSQNSQRHMRA